MSKGLRRISHQAKGLVKTSIAVFVIAVMLASSPAQTIVADAATAAVESSRADTDAIFKYLVNNCGFSKVAACGIMGNLEAESNFRSNNLQGKYETILGLSDQEYTEQLNKGIRDCQAFTEDHAGYGIAQWTYFSRKNNLYKFAVNRNVGISDWKMQLDFMVKELGSRKTTMNQFANTPQGAYEAGAYFCSSYEKPPSPEAPVKRGNLAKNYFAKYVGKGDSEKPSVSKPAETKPSASANKTSKPEQTKPAVSTTAVNSKNPTVSNIKGSVYKVKADFMSIREKNGKKFKELGRIYRGEKFTVIRESLGWGQVKLSNGKYGWVCILPEYVSKVK